MARILAHAEDAKLAVMVISAAFSPDGSRIVTASSDDTAPLWLAFPDAQKLIAYAEKQMPRRLTEKERLERLEELFISSGSEGGAANKLRVTHFADF